jgi:hypothetical protein
MSSSYTRLHARANKNQDRLVPKISCSKDFMEFSKYKRMTEAIKAKYATCFDLNSEYATIKGRRDSVIV